MAVPFVGFYSWLAESVTGRPSTARGPDRAVPLTLPDLSPARYGTGRRGFGSAKAAPTGAGDFFNRPTVLPTGPWSPLQAQGAPARPVVPLRDRWCPWQTCGALARPMVLLQACGAPNKPVVPLTGPWCPSAGRVAGPPRVTAPDNRSAHDIPTSQH